MKSVLVAGSSGNIGFELVKLLLAHSTKPTAVCLTRDAAKLSARLPKSDKLVFAEGGYSDPQYIEKICADNKVDSVFFNVVGDNELMKSYAFMNAIQRSPTVKHIAYLSSAADWTTPESRHWALSCGAHFAVKLIIEDCLRTLYPSGKEGHPTWTILGPTGFFPNDYLLKRTMMASPDNGFIPQSPGNVGASRVSMEDIATAAIHSFENPTKWSGRKVMVGSLTAYKKDQVAKIWSSAMGKPVNVGGEDEAYMSNMEDSLRGFVGPELARSVRMMWATYHQRGYMMTEDQYKEQYELLGREPRSYEEFVNNLAEEWKRESA